MLSSCFCLKDLGLLHYFLGIQVSNTTEGNLRLSQAQYIKNLLHKIHISLSISNTKAEYHNIIVFLA